MVVATALLLAGCGKKGPPLAPLHLIPGPPTALEVRRTGPDARVNLVLPSATNANGPGPSVLDRVEIYAVTLAPGMTAPPNREFLTPKFLVGTIAVKPPPVEGEPAPRGRSARYTPVGGREGDLRGDAHPGQAGRGCRRHREGRGDGRRPPGRGHGASDYGDRDHPGAHRRCPLDAAATATPTAGPAAFAASFAIAASAAVNAAIPKYSVRLYAAQGATSKGRPGQPSARAELPLVDLPGAPSSPIATVTEKSIALTWVAPPGEIPATFNVYKREGGDPLNAAPVAAPPYEMAGVTWGTEMCFVVRAVEKIGRQRWRACPRNPPA